MRAVLPLSLLIACGSPRAPQPEIRIVSPIELQVVDGELVQVEVEVGRVRLVPPPQGVRRGPPSGLPPWLTVRAHAQDRGDDEDESLFAQAFIEIRIAGAPGPRTDQLAIEAPLFNLVDGTHNLDAELIPIEPVDESGLFWPRAWDSVRFVRQLAVD